MNKTLKARALLIARVPLLLVGVIGSVLFSLVAAPVIFVASGQTAAVDTLRRGFIDNPRLEYDQFQWDWTLTSRSFRTTVFESSDRA